MTVDAGPDVSDERLRALYKRALAARDDTTARDRCVSPQALLALARHDGPENERLETLDHVMACDACRRELGLLRAIEEAGALVAAADARPAADRPHRVPAQWMRRAAPLALAASLLLAIGVGVRGRTGGDVPPDVMRGDGQPALMLVTPADADTVVTAGTPLSFAWRPDPGTRRYVLEVLDAGGRAVEVQSTTDTVVTLRDPSRLTPGVDYQWWVRALGDGGGQRTSPVRSLRVRAR